MRWLIPRGQLIGFALIILLVGGLAVFALVKLNLVLTSEALSGREAQASLTAVVMRERFDRLTDLATSLATRVQFREEVEKGLWADAMARMTSIPKDFPFVEGIFLVDEPGVLRAAFPELSTLYGQSFAFREWYKGVRDAEAPYVSDALKRAAEPQLNIIVVAVPVRGRTDPAKTIAYLGFQVRLDTLLTWAQETDYGPDAYAVVVDRTGTLAAHPKFDPQGPLVDYSSVSWVPRALSGASGLETLYNPIVEDERVVAYAPVERYGWAVGVSQGKDEAFKARDRFLTGVYILFAITFGLIVILVISIIRGFSGLQMAKSEFISAASHQLKTPLSGLRWTLESLNIPPEVLTDKQKQYLANLKQYGERLVQSIDGLLNLSRIDLGTVDMRLEDTNPREFLKGVQSDMAGYAAIHEREIRLEVDDDVPTTVALDRQLVYHVVQNFLANAIEYATPKTAVTLRCTTDPLGFRIAVHNTGDPIPPSVQAQLFQKFYRAPEARAMKANGTGVGLYVAKSFAQRWGGTIKLDADGRDITFWVTIPIQ